MKEWQRTIILVALLILGIAYIVWAQHAVDANLTLGI